MLAASVGDMAAGEPDKWTLRDCIEYALENNITVKTGKLSVLSSAEDVSEAKSQMFPSLTFSTTHQGSYMPFPEKNGNGSADHLSYTGDYGLNASWTIYDGSKRKNNISQKELSGEQAELSLAESSNTIQEQIVKLYVQILYVTEAVNVNAQILAISKQNASRGEEMYKVGSLSKADLSQLKAQVATDEYNLVNIKGQLEECKLEMKDLLRLGYDSSFDIALPSSSDEQAQSEVPLAADVLNAAYANRPEIMAALLDVKYSALGIDIAKAGMKPTLNLSGGIGSNTMSGTGMGWGSQMKGNLNTALGFTLSVPIFDNRSTKTAVNKAKINMQQAQLNADDAKNELALTVQGFCINANTNQQRFVAAKASVESAQDSYDLLSEQFRLGLKNIVELTNAKTVLLNAQQSRLESKYMAILYIQLLKFYKGEEMNII